MKLSIFGLGYVGTVSAACLAAAGHTVTGVDVNPVKVGLINDGHAPIVERDIDALVRDQVAAGRLSATTDAGAAMAASDVSLICVGTPSAANGAIDTRALQSVAAEIGAAIAAKRDRHVVVVRSTMVPGTFRGLVVAALEAASGKRAGGDFGVAINPEFLRTGSAVADFRNPEKTVIGTDEPEVAALVAGLYAGLPGTMVKTTPEIAEFVKYVDNPWHAVKVAFANEIGNVGKAMGIDVHAAMDIFLLDRKLNISPAYLKPGFAFGGSCLTKDVRALTHLARSRDIELPLLQSVLPSNGHQVERAAEWVLSRCKRRIALLGCSFKAGTDDMRESPYILLIERLLGRGCAVRVFDENVRVSTLMGANRDYVAATIPHIASLFVETAGEALADAEVVLITAASPEYVAAARCLRADQVLLDFAHIPELSQGDRYDGVNW